MKEGREGASPYLEEEGLARQQRALKATENASSPEAPLDRYAGASWPE